MSHKSQQAYALGSLREALGQSLDELENEITLGTHARHLRRHGHLCRMILDKMKAVGGATLETSSFAERLEQLLAVVEHEAQKAAENPVLRLVR